MPGIVWCINGIASGVIGTLGPYANLLTKRKSPINIDFSIEEVGIVYASIKKVRKIVAAITANKIASIQFLISLFLDFFFLFLQNCQLIVSKKMTSANNRGVKYSHSPSIKYTNKDHIIVNIINNKILVIFLFVSLNLPYSIII